MGNAAADGGGGAGGETEITIAAIRQIANTTMSNIQHGAKSETTSFRNTHLGEGAFGEVPLAQDFAAQQRAAHTVFTETISGVIADLETFATNLRASAESHQANDDAVEATMRQLNSEYAGDHTYESEKKNVEARHNRDLIVGNPDEAAAQHAAGTDAPSDSGTGSGTGADAATASQTTSGSSQADEGAGY